MNDTPLIRCEQINKYYKMGAETIHALEQINLTVTQGEYIAVLGASGSGKSTLMNILGCLDHPSSGQYYLDGEDVSHLSMPRLARIRNQKIGFIFQGFHLLPYANALDNVALPLMYRGVKLIERRRQAQALLERVGLGQRLTHLPSELSGGQQQRVAIARALINQPQLILADEPTGNLDSHSGQEVMDIFSELLAGGKTIIVVTHDNQLAQRMSRIIRLQDGKMV